MWATAWFQMNKGRRLAGAGQIVEFGINIRAYLLTT